MKAPFVALDAVKGAFMYLLPLPTRARYRPFTYSVLCLLYVIAR